MMYRYQYRDVDHMIILVWIQYRDVDHMIILAWIQYRDVDHMIFLVWIQYRDVDHMEEWCRGDVRLFCDSCLLDLEKQRYFSDRPGAPFSIHTPSLRSSDQRYGTITRSPGDE
jgi:hypothetical protein